MPANQRKKLAPRRKMKPGRFTKQEINKMKKQLGFKRMNLRATTNLGTRIRGKGDYVVSEDPATQAQRLKNRNTGFSSVMPWNDTTGSVGVVNRGARAIGNALGGESLGNAASWLSRAFGFGDYAIKSNTLNNANIAQFKNHGSIEFAHREFITDITSTTGFANYGYIINPGNSALFPWLSTIAKNFEQYQMLGLIFEFKSTSATAVGSTNTGLGTVIMATDYDVLDSPYADKRAMEVAEFSTSAAPFVSQIHPIECDPKQNVMRQLFIQPGNSISSYPDDPRFSALGNFQIATAGMQAASVIGELWVSYHVRLLKPQLESGVTTSDTRLHIGLTTAAGGSPTLNYVDQTQPGALTAALVGGRLEITAASNAGLGKYIIMHGYRSNTATTTLVATGITYPYPLFTGTASFLSLSYNASGTKNAENTNYINCSFNNTSTGGADYNPTSTSYIVNMPSLYDKVQLPIFYNAAQTVYHDVYIAPYSTNFVGQISEVKNNDYQLEELRKMFADLRSKQEKTNEEFVKLKEEVFDESDDSGDELSPEEKRQITQLINDEAREKWEHIHNSIAESENRNPEPSSSTANAPQTVQLVAMHKKDAKKYLDSLKKQTSI